MNEDLDFKKYDFYKNNDGDIISWVDVDDNIGYHVFTFDGNKFYNLFIDYPNNMTQEQVEIFNRENPFWRDFFNG